jgi:hypothetical protein
VHAPSLSRFVAGAIRSLYGTRGRTTTDFRLDAIRPAREGTLLRHDVVDDR